MERQPLLPWSLQLVPSDAPLPANAQRGSAVTSFTRWCKSIQVLAIYVCPLMFKWEISFLMEYI